MTTPTAGPWDSPKAVIRNNCPKLLLPYTFIFSSPTGRGRWSFSAADICCLQIILSIESPRLRPPLFLPRSAGSSVPGDLTGTPTEASQGRIMKLDNARLTILSFTSCANLPSPHIHRSNLLREEHTALARHGLLSSQVASVYHGQNISPALSPE